MRSSGMPRREARDDNETPAPPISPNAATPPPIVRGPRLRDGLASRQGRVIAPPVQVVAGATESADSPSPASPPALSTSRFTGVGVLSVCAVLAAGVIAAALIISRERGEVVTQPEAVNVGQNDASARNVQSDDRVSRSVRQPPSESLAADGGVNSGGDSDASQRVGRSEVPKSQPPENRGGGGRHAQQVSEGTSRRNDDADRSKTRAKTLVRKPRGAPTKTLDYLAAFLSVKQNYDEAWSGWSERKVMQCGYIPMNARTIAARMAMVRGEGVDSRLLTFSGQFADSHMRSQETLIQSYAEALGKLSDFHQRVMIDAILGRDPLSSSETAGDFIRGGANLKLELEEKLAKVKAERAVDLSQLERQWTELLEELRRDYGSREIDRLVSSPPKIEDLVRKRVGRETGEATIAYLQHLRRIHRAYLQARSGARTTKDFTDASREKLTAITGLKVEGVDEDLAQFVDRVAFHGQLERHKLEEISSRRRSSAGAGDMTLAETFNWLVSSRRARRKELVVELTEIQLVNAWQQLTDALPHEYPAQRVALEQVASRPRAFSPIASFCEVNGGVPLMDFPWHELDANELTNALVELEKREWESIDGVNVSAKLLRVLPRSLELRRLPNGRVLSGRKEIDRLDNNLRAAIPLITGRQSFEDFRGEEEFHYLQLVFQIDSSSGRMSFPLRRLSVLDQQIVVAVIRRLYAEGKE